MQLQHLQAAQRHLLQITTTPAAGAPTTGVDAGIILLIVAGVIFIGVLLIFFYLHYVDHHFFRHELDYIIYFHPHHASVRSGKKKNLIASFCPILISPLFARPF